jgi:hypothetical protein
MSALLTDGERLVWASIYALAVERGDDSITAVRAATHAITQLRETAALRKGDGTFVISQVDERECVDEMVNAP